MFEIRRLRPDDRDGVVETIKAVYDEYGFAWYPDSYHRDLYELDEHYLAPGIPFWVAESDAGIIGTGALMPHPAIEGEGVVEVDGVRRVGGTQGSLERVYVHPSARRLGIGRALNDVAIAEARTLKMRGVEIWSDKRFEAAHELYRSLGAIEVGDRLCHDPEGSPEWGFLLRLR